MSRAAVAGLALALAVAAGCGGQWGFGPGRTGPGRAVPRTVDRVDFVDLWAVPPAAVNWDDVPGPDGVQARVFLFLADRPEPVLGKGTLEFLMFEGRVSRESLETARPWKVWSYGQPELATRQCRGVAGWGYAAQLGWGRDMPSGSAVTVAARYIPPEGPPVYSAPLAIALPSKVSGGPIVTTLGGEPVYRAPGAPPEKPSQSPPLKFRRNVIDPDPPGAQHDVTLLADVNRDGRLDVIIGCKRGQTNLFWYENPSWARHDMASAPNLEAGGVVFDVNADGRPDVVVGQQFGGKELYWFECPSDPAQPWTRHLIENRYEKYHDQAVGDVDGDGKPEIVVLSQRAGVLVYYDIPADPRVEPWPKECCHLISSDMKDVEGLVVADLDGDGRPEILAGTNIFRRDPADGSWKAEQFAKGFKMVRLAVADLDGDGRLDIVMSEGETQPARLVWLKAPDWTPRILRQDLFHPHSLAVADFNGDRLADIFVGEMGLGRNLRPRMFIYAGAGGGRFHEVLIWQGVPVHEAKVGDLNGDGRPDIVGKPYEPERHIDAWINETEFPASAGGR